MDMFDIMLCVLCLMHEMNIGILGVYSAYIAWIEVPTYLNMLYVYSKSINHIHIEEYSV